MFAFALAAGVAAVFAGLAALLFEVVEFEVVEFVLVVAGVEAGVAGATLVVLVLVLLALLLALFVAASPQAMPRALRPRTVESTITFFILKLRLLISFLKVLSRSLETPADRNTAVFCLELFLFRAKVKI